MLQEVNVNCHLNRWPTEGFFEHTARLPLIAESHEFFFDATNSPIGRELVGGLMRERVRLRAPASG
jgi:hypothetical protein